MKWLAELPSTNFRIFMSVWLAAVYVLTVLGGILRGAVTDANNATLYLVGGFLLIMMGLDVAQFKFKRDSYLPSPPAEPDVEDAGGKG